MFSVLMISVAITNVRTYISNLKNKKCFPESLDGEASARWRNVNLEQQLRIA